MPLIPDQDFVICPKVNLMVKAGICTGLAIATQAKIFIIPDNTIGSAGFTATKTTYSIGEKSPLAAVQAWLLESDFTTAELEKRLHKLFSEDWKIDDPLFTIDVRSLSEFKIKAGWLSKGLYYKRQGQTGWYTIAFTSKDRVLALQNFYPQAER